MIIEISDKGFLDREIIIKLPKSEFNLAKEKKIIHFSKSLNLKGFRKGFIPYNIVTSRFGKQIYDDILNDLLYKNLIDFIKKNNVNFVKFPKLKMSDYTSFDEYLLFIFEFEIYPVINIDFSKVKILKYKSLIDDIDIDIEIDRLRKLYGSWKAVTDYVIFGDKITFEIFDFNNSSVFYGQDVLVNSDYTKLTGFLDFILFKKINIEYYVFFENDVITDSLDKDKKFIFKIVDIKRFNLSDVDSIFYNNIGFDGTYDLKSFIKTSLNSIKFDIIDTLLKRDMIDSLLINNDFFIPNSILYDKISEFKNNGLIKGHDDIVNTVRIDLLLRDIINRFNLHVSKDDVFKVLSDKYNNKTKLDDSLYNYIESEIYIEKIKEVLLSKVYIEEKEIKFADLLRLGDNL